jgi:hypothetical protein
MEIGELHVSFAKSVMSMLKKPLPGADPGEDPI